MSILVNGVERVWFITDPAQKLLYSSPLSNCDVYAPRLIQANHHLVRLDYNENAVICSRSPEEFEKMSFTPAGFLVPTPESDFSWSDS